LYVVIVYRIAHKPVAPRVAIAEIFAAAEPAVRHVGEPVGYADADEHAIHLVRLVVLVGPPYAGAQALAGGGYPVFSVAVFLEIKPTVPRCPFGLNGITGIKYSKRIHLSFADGFRKIDEDRIELPFERQLLPVVHHAVYAQVIEQVE